MKEAAKTFCVMVAFLALFAWALYVIMLAAAAQAHILPMSEVRAGIAREIERQFSIRVIHQLSNCVRVGAHRGQCVIRLYTLPYREKYCGVGWTQLMGKRQYSRANLTPCPGPARGLPGEHPDGHPIPVALPPPDQCRGRRAPKVCRYDDRFLRFPHPKPCPSWCQNTKRWV